MNSVDTILSRNALLTVYTQPVITSQPKDSSVTENTPVSFTVAAAGNPTPTYQWKKNGAVIAGQTNALYQIISTQKSDAGTYSVDVMNAVDTVPSINVTLTVTYKPVITAQPRDTTVRVCDTVTFSVSANGNPAVSYQWMKNGSDISGANASSYTINSVEPTDSGNYSVQVFNTEGNTPSLEAKLTVQMEMLDRRDSRIYRVVQIGSQIWMAENLNYQPTGPSDSSWYYNNDINNGITYGRLYDWYTATGNICPPGWHLPSKTEFETLRDYAGGEAIAAGKLKSTSLWDTGPGTDDYGFTALPAGMNDIFYKYYFQQLLVETSFWASSTFDSENAYEMH